MKTTLSPALTAAYAQCRAIAKREAKNFYYAFRILPPHKSDAMCAVYAFMRQADDLADNEELTLDQRRVAMATWTAAWHRAQTGATSDPVFLALHDTQQRFAISNDLLEQLVAGTTLDLDPQPAGVLLYNLPDGRVIQLYESFPALQHYCYLVASVVGLVIIRIFGYTGSAAEPLAIDTGIAFQLTNILRDVKEDADRGRIYLPADLLQEKGIAPNRVIELSAGSPIQANETALLQALEQHAEKLYQSANKLIPLLDADSRPAMEVLVSIYHRLLQRIARNHAAIFRERVSVPTTEKLSILALGAIRSIGAR